MKVAFKCPLCGYLGNSPSEFQGRKVACPKCKGQFELDAVGPGMDQVAKVEVVGLSFSAVVGAILLAWFIWAPLTIGAVWFLWSATRDR